MCAIPSASIFSLQLWQIGETEEGKEDGILCPQHGYLTTVAFDKDNTREVSIKTKTYIEQEDNFESNIHPVIKNCHIY